MSTVSTGGSLGRGSRALHLQHHQSSLSALHMTANHSGTVDRRRSSLRVTYRIDSKTPGPFTTAPGTRWYFLLSFIFLLAFFLELMQDTIRSLQIAIRARFYLFLFFLIDQFPFSFVYSLFSYIAIRNICNGWGEDHMIQIFNRNNKFLCWLILHFFPS